jgi:hypothetical protein
MQRGWSVAGPVNNARTQNGHIRNDTRDVSRRSSSLSNSPICRRNCVGSDRACSRVNGKQGVCRGLPPVAGGPLPVKEGVDVLLGSTVRGYFLLQSGHGH